MAKNFNNKNNTDDFGKGKGGNQNAGSYRSKTGGKGNGNRKGSNKRNQNSNFKSGSNNSSRYDSDGSSNKVVVNDPSWYGATDNNKKSVFRLPTINALGAPLSFQNHKFTAPGIMALHYMPTFGMLENSHDPGNLAMSIINQDQRAANSGSINYDKTDQFIFIEAVTHIYMLYWTICRAVMMWKYFNGLNYYAPQAMLDALGFDPDSLMNSVPQIWARLDMLAAQINRLWTPKFFKASERAILLCTSIFQESDSWKSPYYAFVPDGFYILEEAEAQTGTRLRYVDVTAMRDIDDYVDLLQEMIDKVFEMQEGTTIMGDLLKAYGFGNLTAVSVLNAGEIIQPLPESNVNWQIHNMHFAGKPYGPNYLTQDPNQNVLICKPRFRGLPFTLMHSKLLDFNEAVPDEAAIAENTRLIPAGVKNIVPDGNTGAFLYNVAAYGAEIPTYMTVSTFAELDGTWKYIKEEIKDVYTLGEMQKFIHACYLVNMFKLHPQITLLKESTEQVKTVETLEGATPLARLFDVNNYTVIDNDALSQMHAIADYCLYAVEANPIKLGGNQIL